MTLAESEEGRMTSEDNDVSKALCYVKNVNDKTCTDSFDVQVHKVLGFANEVCECCARNYCILHL